ncbi:MAG TPA: FecR domain-containing protein [Xanthobacteraceae bacterium]|jgi:ferric-dicitrate binding protein FerR (iron transport regulator)|nr:FecR domain-containing protein [Xanthobacteraceae bacterium]
MLAGRGQQAGLQALKLAAFAAASLWCADAAFAQSKIGVAATVKNQVFGGSQPLAAGGNVHANEVIRTGDASSAQLLFVDQTTLLVGAKSEVKLDRFVYDPNRGNGNVVMNAGKGVFRFVSGAQQSKSYQINTPVATIGVRGTVFTFAYSGTQLYLTTSNGSVIVRILPNGPTVDVPAGYSIVVYPNGTYQKFQSSDTTNFLRNAGLDQRLLEEYSNIIGEHNNTLGGLKPSCRSYYSCSN